MGREATDDFPILVIEDSDEDFDVLQITFANLGLQNQLLRCTEGVGVLPLLKGRLEASLPVPGFILLDLNLIGIDGREVLRRLKSHLVFRKIPVIVFSTSSSRTDIELCYLNGAAAYVVKPVGLDKLELFIERIKAFWLDTAILPRTS